MKQILKYAFSKLGYQLRGTRYVPRHLLDAALTRSVEFDDVVCRHMFERGSELGFIQIGVYDGITHDPLRRYIEKCNWHGVLVEPQSRSALQLRKLYASNERISILQAALDCKSGQRTLFTVNSPQVPSWAGGLASFDRNSITKHADLIPGLEDMICEETVDCKPFEDVLEQLNNQELDILQIDTEGADGYILSLFPFDRIKPPIVHWEIKHLKKNELEACLDRLAGFGYRFALSGDEDMLAVRF